MYTEIIQSSLQKSVHRGSREGSGTRCLYGINWFARLDWLRCRVSDSAFAGQGKIKPWNLFCMNRSSEKYSRYLVTTGTPSTRRSIPFKNSSASCTAATQLWKISTIYDIKCFAAKMVILSLVSSLHVKILYCSTQGEQTVSLPSGERVTVHKLSRHSKLKRWTWLDLWRGWTSRNPVDDRFTSSRCGTQSYVMQVRSLLFTTSLPLYHQWF